MPGKSHESRGAAWAVRYDFHSIIDNLSIFSFIIFVSSTCRMNMPFVDSAFGVSRCVGFK